MNSKYCHFYIVRHGETEWNKLGILQGHSDSPLTEEGIKQAEERAKTFKNVEFSDAFSSDSFRAERTAKIILAEKQVAITTTKLLRERSFGAFDGKELARWQKELRRQLEYTESLTQEQRFKHKVRDDVESDEEITNRMLTFIRETAVAYPGKNVLVVTHGGIMRALLIKLGFGSYSTLPRGSVKNTAYVIIETDGIEFFVKESENVGLPENLS